MRGCSYLVWAGFASILAVFDGFSAVSSSFPAERAAHTNWVENTVTNLIEVRMSRNRFVTEYRTNWVDHVSTNVFDLYKTNRLVRNVTNRFIVDAWRTNFVDAYRTNWQRLNLTNDIAIHATLTNVIDAYHTNWLSRNVTNNVMLTRYQTNFVDSYHTNWKQLVLTNDLAVNLVRTNFVTAYHTNWHDLQVTNEVAVDRVRTNFVAAFSTNWQTLSLTNWQTVVSMKTNWVTQFVTNVAQIDLPRTVTVTQAAPETAAAAANTHSATTEPPTGEDPVIEVSRTSRPPANGLVEVELKIKWPADTADAPPVQQWRIEREGGAFLSFGQDQECRKELPVGNYLIQARLQRDADSPAFLLKGTLTVTIKEAVVQQRTDRSKLAAVMGR